MNTIMQTLKKETWPCHERLERQLDLLNSAFSASDYSRLLMAFLGYYRPVESHLNNYPELRQWIPDLELRAKTQWLENDLSVLGIADEVISQMPLCQDFPPITNIPSALGSLYVLEGATLGGRIIADHMNQLLGIGASNGGAFFQGYGDKTIAMWQFFGERMVAAVDSLGPVEAAIVASACMTFESLGRWLVDRNIAHG